MQPPSLSITARARLWGEDADTWHITQKIHKYWHTIEAVGGFWSAQFTIRGGRSLVDDWLQDGLGRHIEVYDHSLTCIWEGFANKLTVNYGPLAATRGPLLDAANRVDLVYSAITYDEDDNPVVGTRVNTGVENNTDSQALWGIIPQVLSTGGVDAADALNIRDSYLENHNLPATGKEYRSDASSETSVTVDCLGYVHWLNWPYNNGLAGEDDADVKILDVLGDTPNIAWLIYNTSHVSANLLHVPMWEDEDNLAWSVIKDVVARGGTSQERWLFGIYAGMEAHYKAAPTTVEYQQRLSQSRPKIEFAGGDQVYEIFPWNVLPGKWLMFPDFLIGQAAEFNLRDDPRAMFIEQVKFTAPNDLYLKGGTVDTTDALIAQLGLGGIGA